jgi:hypothetical protein
MRLPFTVRDRDVQANFDWLLKRFLDTGGRSGSIRFGTAVVTFSAADTSDTETVTHGLGTTPVAVVVSANIFSPGIFAVTQSVGATTFQTRAITRSGTHTGDVTIFWIAVG